MHAPKRTNPDVVAAPLGRYSHLVEVPPGHRLCFISGQVGVRPDGSLAGVEVAAQAEAALANIDALLGAAGATPDQLIRLQSFVVGRENLPGFRTALGVAYDRWYAAVNAERQPTEAGPPEPNGPPGHTLLVVAGLAAPELLVEIEAWFAVPPEPARRQIVPA
ncbi:MAG: RidA family protein [Mycobacteriales bacterium]